ncbi:MAG: hypothetical protein SH859_02620, partial [Hyphomicrobium aestuarii]|nr:hypothetical protein [Hyphomicrobium aestuarii]
AMTEREVSRSTYPLGRFKSVSLTLEITPHIVMARFGGPPRQGRAGCHRVTIFNVTGWPGPAGP